MYEKQDVKTRIESRSTNKINSIQIFKSMNNWLANFSEVILVLFFFKQGIIILTIHFVYSKEKINIHIQ
jgi:hypothetical protein